MTKFLYVLFLFTNILFAQELSISGVVINSKGEPIIGANIILGNTGLGASADLIGNFTISDIPKGIYRIIVSAVGYKKQVIEEFFVDKEIPGLNFILETEIIETDQLIVTAGKYKQNIKDLPVSSFVLQPADIERQNFQSLDEILRYIPGVSVTLDQLSIRGSSGYSRGAGTRVLVALDGIPLYSGDTGDIVWELIPITDIERIEVIKGPASSLYGSTAIGGVINIITKEKVTQAITHFNSYAGFYDNPSYHEWKWTNKTRTFYQLGLSHSNSIGSLGYTLSLKRIGNDSYRENDYNQRYLGYLKLNYDFDEFTKLSLVSNLLWMNRGNYLYWKDSRNVLVPKDEDRDQYVKSNRQFLGLILEHKFNDNIIAQLKSSYYRTDFDGIGVEVTSALANLFRNEIIINNTVSDKINLVSGAEFSYTDISSNLFSSPHFLSAAGFSQIEYKGIENLSTTLGLRYDFIKLDSLAGSSALTPRIGLNYKVSDDFILRSSFSTGFRAPTPAEVYTTGTLSSISIEENTDLKSETSLSFEAGVLYDLFSNLNFDLAFFQNEYNDFIEPNLTQEGTIKFVNLSKARIQGIDFVTRWNLFDNNLNLTFGYVYLSARDIDNNKPMKYRPKNQLYINTTLNYYPFLLNLDFRHWSRVEEIDENLTSPPLVIIPDGDSRVSVYVADISFGYNFILNNIPLRMTLDVKNFLNYNYVEFIGNLSPIRNYSLQFQAYF